jgi:hypothetical protein
MRLWRLKLKCWILYTDGLRKYSRLLFETSKKLHTREKREKKLEELISISEIPDHKKMV